MCKQGFGICKDRGRVAVVWELVPSMSKAGFHVIPPVMDGAVAGVFWGRVVCAKLLQKVLPLVPAQKAGRSIAQGSPEQQRHGDGQREVSAGKPCVGFMWCMPYRL